MMDEHATAEDLAALRRKELDPAAILDLTRHLAVCAACAAAARATVDAERVEADLRREVEGVRRRRPLAWWAAAAAAAIAIVIIALALPPRRPKAEPGTPLRRVIVTPAAPAPQTAELRARDYGRRDWNALVQSALADGRLEMPRELRDLQRQPESVRNLAGHAARAELRPAGVIVESDRPLFSWNAVDRATSYTVEVFDGDRRIAQESGLHTTNWQPNRPLRRGRVYTWQVRVALPGDETAILPAPPDPPAVFRILDRAAFDEIAEAKRSFPDDPLLLGVLYARAGLEDRAREEIAKYAAAHPESAISRRLLDSMTRWKEPRS